MKIHLPQRNNTFLGKLSAFLRGSLEKTALSISSEALEREVELDVFVHRPAFSLQGFSLLLLNDGQDIPALQLEKTLHQLYQEKALAPLLIVGIKAGDRMQEYGTAVQADYAQRGARAKQYTDFILQELLPFLKQNFSLTSSPDRTAFAGFSLGGLSALDIVWNHPTVFHRVGVFSGSLWWRSTPFDESRPDDDLIMHTQIAQGSKHTGLRFWLQTGTHDETSDRNNNGIIDAIDDTLSLIKNLETLGYQQGKDITYVEVEKGEHHPGTWGAVMPDFLKWCFGKN